MTTMPGLPSLPGLRPSGPVAERLADAVRPFVGGDLPVRLRAWDGSEAGPPDVPLLELCGPIAVQRMLWNPGELGAAQAYVAGDLVVHDDLGKALEQVRTELARRETRGVGWNPTPLARAVRTALGVGALGLPPAPPASQAQVRGSLHSRLRDRRAVSFHYDVSNEFYGLLLGEPMAYSCAYWTSTDPAYTVHDAQRDKLDLVCRKLGLEPGMTLLDVGCGWGSLALHAAQHYGVQVTGVTISSEQQRYAEAQVSDAGVADQVEIRLQDYRDVSGHWDAVASIEMGEHVGAGNYPRYARTLTDVVRPGGRVLVQQMSRPGPNGGRHPGGGPFIEAFVAPDMHMRPVGETVAFLEAAGLEVRDVHALREHYVRTVEGWLGRFDAHQDELTSLVGEEVMRVWRLYLVGGAMTFRDGRMGVDQILAVRPGERHGVPAVRGW